MEVWNTITSHLLTMYTFPCTYWLWPLGTSSVPPFPNRVSRKNSGQHMITCTYLKNSHLRLTLRFTHCVGECGKKNLNEPEGFFSFRCALYISTKRSISEIWDHSYTWKIWNIYWWYIDCVMSSFEIPTDYRQ